MTSSVKKLPGSQLEITVEISVAEIQPQLQEAAEHLSEHRPIAGFRPGKAPFELVKKEFGEMAILEHAADHLIGHTFVEVVKTQGINTIGQPQISVEKMAPGNPIVYKALVAILPKMKLADWKKHKVQRQEVKVAETDITRTLEDLRQMRATEVLTDRPAGKTDKIIIDMDIAQNKVPVEGGQTKDHAVYLDQNYYIPGLPEQLLGLKKGDIKEFVLFFPKEHYQKHLAGKQADFKVTVKDVFERTLPELNDEFAKSLGQTDVAGLKKILGDNLRAEAEQKEEQRLEIEIIKGLVEKTKFEDLPELLMKEEKHKMFAELKASLAERGLPFEEYLKNIKKTEEDLAKDFDGGAKERVKTALLLREIAREEKVTISKEEMDQELQRLRELYHDNPNLEDRLADPDTQDYVRAMLMNRKIVTMLKKQVTA